MSTNAQMNGKRRSEEKHSAPNDGSGRVASSGKRLKMTKDSHNKDEAEPDDDDVLASILPLRLTTLGGYLPLKDTGRFLLRVSKDMTGFYFGRQGIGGHSRGRAQQWRERSGGW